MEKHIPKGYKKTEVGIIPEDWDISALGDLVKIRSGESPSYFKFVGKGFPYFKVDELNNSEKFAVKTKYFISAADKLVPKGSLIFPKRGASIFQNKIRILKNDSYMDTNLMTLTVSDSISNEYCYYQLNYIGLSKVADTTSVPQINNKHIKPFYIPVPLQLEEQKAIATVLSDVDNLITSLEQLIEKKKAIKQGTMQELLTGRRRLKGFGEGKGYKQTELGMIPEDWRIVSLGNCLEKICNGAIYKEGKNNSVMITRIETISDGKINYSRTGHVSGSYISENFLLHKDDILYSHINSLAHIGKVAYYFGEQKLYHGMNLLLLRSNKEILDSQYLFKFLSSDIGRRYSRKLAKQAINQASISISDLAELKIPLPLIIEQATIANVLHDIDSEIENLEAKVDKYKQIKQGMMQNLLTGRIRLV